MSSMLLGQGIYTVNEAGRLIGAHPAVVRTWFRQRHDRHVGPILQPTIRTSKSPNVISFADLIEALIVRTFREFPVSFSYLRKVRGRLVREFGTPHPFCRKGFYTDGRKIFISAADAMGEVNLKEVLANQQAFPSILMPYLSQIDYDDETLMALRWHKAPGVVIDPKRKYGKPVIDALGIPTSVLAAACRANANSAAEVARWYNISEDAVRQAVQFERELGNLAA